MKLAFEKHGRGEPVLVMHGLFGSRDNWHSFGVRLAERFEVYLVDQRNHGRSPHAELMDYEVLAADAAEFVRREIGRAAHVLGHSMGGKTGMELALSHGELVRSLVVVDIGPGAYPFLHARLIEAIVGLEAGKLQDRREAEEALAGPIPDSATRRFLLKNLARVPGGGFAWRLGLKEIAAAYPKLSAAIAPGRQYDGPVWVLKGERSEYVRTEDMAAARRLFPRAELLEIANAGHWMQVENPQDLEKVVIKAFAAGG